MTDQSRKGLPPELQSAAGKIVVNADGTFGAFELPEILNPPPPYDTKVRMRLDSGNGVWKLASWEGAEHLQLDFSDLKTVDQKSRSSYGFPLTISRDWSGTDLSYSLGDPDEGLRVELEKK